ncbi:hypothetical protein LJY25_04080 [Hymenobacter sp. BT175]|uniref:hypothetical protein n=1 Tax=Hymenobacter translucens TaxID=2886507 RepID=UPI001D0E51D8|nr:hypothetical protein [Hymenobacter translucens]MCC2545611.1 hypothetical protein [Hymenobacter translucens]
MLKIFVLLFLSALLIFAPGEVDATAAVSSEALTDMALAPGPRVHRPNYKPYRGNSRSRHRKMGLFRRWKARRAAKRKIQSRPAKAAPRQGVISVDKPTGVMPPKPKE